MFEIPELRDLGERILERTIGAGLYRGIRDYEPITEYGKVTYAEGYPITGIEKFLGYFNKEFNIAFFPSISFNTDFSVARAACEYIKETGEDSVILDGQTNAKYTERAIRALNFFKNLHSIEGSFKFYIERKRRYEDAKGLGESAAIASSVSRALMRNVFGDEGGDDDMLVSRFARLVSGSGTRSATGGFSMWISYPWITESDCYAVKLPVDYKNFYFVAFPDRSEITTANAHDIAYSSPFYSKWAYNKYDRLNEIISNNFSIGDLMKKSEEDMYFLNSLLMSQGTIIQNERSIGLIQRIKKFSEKSKGLFMTTDTGPSIVLMSNDKSLLDEFVSSEKAKHIKGTIPDRPPKEPDKEFKKTAEDYFSRTKVRGISKK